MFGSAAKVMVELLAARSAAALSAAISPQPIRPNRSERPSLRRGRNTGGGAVFLPINFRTAPIAMRSGLTTSTLDFHGPGCDQSNNILTDLSSGLARLA